MKEDTNKERLEKIKIVNTFLIKRKLFLPDPCKYNPNFKAIFK